MHIGRDLKMGFSTRDREQRSSSAQVSSHDGVMEVCVDKRLLLDEHARRRIADNRNIVDRTAYPSTSPFSPFSREQQSGMKRC